MQPYNQEDYIDCESVYSSSSAVKQSGKTLRRINSSATFVLSLTSSTVVITEIVILGINNEAMINDVLYRFIDQVKDEIEPKRFRLGH